MATRSQREEFVAGARDIAPVLLGTLPFGFVAGVAAIASGLTALEGLALSALSFSGIAQLIVCQLIAARSPLPVIVAAAVVVSLRHLMYSAAVSPHLAHLARGWRALLAFLLTDQTFAMTVQRYSEPGDRSRRHWYVLGCSVTLYAFWQAAVLGGIILGAQIPESWGLDFVVVLTFIALLVPVVRTRADLAAAIVAAGMVLVAAGLPYRLALVAGSLAGIAAGLAIERTRTRR